MSCARILVVDDELSHAEVVALILREEGYQVTVAGDGAQALERLDEAAPDLLITDLMMPGMSGTALARAARQRCSPGRLRVLLMSGAAASALGVHGDGFDAFLRKPFDLDTLLQAVRSLLGAPA